MSRDNSASAYVLCLLDPFFVLIYKGLSKGQSEEEYEEGCADNQVLEEVKNDKDLLR